VTGALALLTIPLGSELAAVAQLAALVCVFVVMLSTEAAFRRSRPLSASGPTWAG